MTPGRITLLYVVLGFGALYVSDVLLVRYLEEPALSQVQALKGGAEVVLTAVLIFVLTTSREYQLTRKTRNLAMHREELQVLHRVLRHNLRNDVNVVQGHASLLRRRATDEQIAAHAEKILDVVGQMTHYTEQAKRINQITEQNGAFRTVDLSEVIRDVLEDNRSITPAVDVTTDLADGALVEVDPMFREALSEVVTNAVTHNDADRPAVTIEVSPTEGPQQYVRVQITDNGPGIPSSQLAPLEAGGEEQLLHLDGMGLWLVEWTVRNSGGEIEIDTGSDGTTVTILVPKSPRMFDGPLSAVGRATT